MKRVDKKIRGNTKGQISLSFGMIFSIILIIIFVVVAFYAINKFLNLQKDIQVKQFTTNLQRDVNNIWQGSQGSQEVVYKLPKKIKAVCFVNFSDSDRGIDSGIFNELRPLYEDNVAFYPALGVKGSTSFNLENINLREMTSTNNPFCIQILNGEIKMKIVMNPDEALARIVKI